MPATVQPGDTLWAIAARHLGDGGRWAEIHALNQALIPDPNAIEAGQVLQLPGDSAPSASWSDAASSAASDAWASMRSSWESVRQGWSEGWQALDDKASGLYDAIVAAPETYRAKVEGFVAALTTSKQNLTWIRAHEGHLSTQEKVSADALGQRYNDLAAGFLSDVDGGEALQLGAGPLLIVAGLGVGVAAIAWAVASYEHAANLRDQTALFREDLAARVTASQQGLTLQPATVPQTLPAPSPVSAPSSGWSLPGSPTSTSSSMVGLVLIAGLGLASAAVLLPLLRRS